VRAVWAAGLLLRRLRTEGGIILLTVILVGSTSFVFAAAPRLFNRVSDAALRSIAQGARPADRNLALNLIGSITPSTDGGVSSVRAYGDDLAKQIPPALSSVVVDRAMRITTNRYYVPNPPLIETHISLRYQDGVQDATRLVSGRWPVATGSTLHPVAPNAVDLGTGEPPAVLEVALSTAEATVIGVGLGDRLGITLDGTDPLVLGTTGFASQGLNFRGGYRIGPAQVVIVGLFEPLDPEAELWYGDAGLLQVEHHGDEDNPIAYVTAYMAPEEYPAIWHGGLPFHLEWRFLVDPELLDAGQVDQLQADLHRLSLLSGSGTSGAGTSGAGSTVSVLTGLPAILDRYAAERALSESVLSIGAIGPFGLAAGAMAMVAILLVRRRRATLALARGRGATGSLLLGTQLWESTLIAGGAALLGLLVAVLVVPARPNPLSPVLAVGVGLTAVLLLVGANWSTARRSLGQLERDDAPVLRVPARRLVIEMTIVGIAVAATLLLRQRGLTIGSSAGVALVDPLLASVPVLAGLAAGILAVRLYPLPIRALGWLAAGRRDIVPVLGLRTIGRQPAAANLPILVLLLTAAFGAFSSVIASSLDHGQAVASYLDVGADYRIDKIGIGGLATAVNPASVAGVEAVAPGITDPLAGFVGATNQRASIHMEAVDPQPYAQVTAGTAADPHWPLAFVSVPGGDGIGTAGNPIPAILSNRLPTGSKDLAPGDTFQMLVEGRSLTFALVERRPSFPGIEPGVSFAVIPFDWVQAAFGSRLVSPSILWLRAPDGLSADLAAQVKGVGDEAHVVSRYDVYEALHEAPFGAVIETGYGAALVTAAVFMALTVIGAVVLSAARRTRDLAFLRTLGVTDLQGLALIVMEHAPPVVLAIVPGVALGIGIAILCEPGLGLATFVGAAGVPLYVDLPALVVTVVALVGVVAVAVAAGTWLSRRVRMADALRIGDD
jgi:putative ABC transport system permease protein